MPNDSFRPAEKEPYVGGLDTQDQILKETTAGQDSFDGQAVEGDAWMAR
jgi:hypothetical protein